MNAVLYLKFLPNTQTGSSTSLTLLLNRDADSDIQFTIGFTRGVRMTFLEQVDVHIDDMIEIMTKVKRFY